MKLSDPKVASFGTGKQLNRATLSPNGRYAVYNGGLDASGRHNAFNTEGPSIIVSQGGASAGFVNYIDERFWAGAHCYVVTPGPAVERRYLYHVLKSRQTGIQSTARGAGIPGLSRSALAAVEVPVPSLRAQKDIVHILDQFTLLQAELAAELSARRRQHEYYRSEFLALGESVPYRPLGDLAQNLDSRRKPVTRAARTPGEIPYYGASGVVDFVKDFIFEGDFLLVSEDGANLLARSTPIAFSISGKSWVNNHAHVLRFNSYAERRFVEIYLNSIDLSPFISGAAQPKLNKASLNKIPVPDPPLHEKERIVAVLDKFEALVNDSNVGLPAEISARQRQYEYYRDRLLTFEETPA